MGLLGNLIGGVFGLAADVTGAVIDAGIDAHNEKKLQQQLDGNVAMLDNFMNQCVSLGKESVLDAKHELYRNGLSEAADDAISSIMSLSGFHHMYLKSIKDDDCLDKVYEYVTRMYDTLFGFYEKYAEDDTMRSDFASSKADFIVKVKSKISELIAMKDGIVPDLYKSLNFTLIVSLLCTLKVVCEDNGYDETVKALHEYQGATHVIFTSLHPLEHGEFELDDPRMIDIDKVQEKIESVKEHLNDNQSGYYEGIRDYLNSGFLYTLGLKMWYYAALTPFNQACFDEAADELNEYKAIQGNDLERVLAEVYVKNKLGGEMLVMQNIDEIMDKASVKNPVYARALCSFLAWIECYQVELEVLKKAVAEKIQLTPDMLERLEFLAKGGASNKIKVYNVQSDDDVFRFDSSAEEIDNAGIDALFDALQRKRQSLCYSLVMKKWTKTIPLPKGKLFSVEALDDAFTDLVNDFDGEIEYKTGNAAAVDLANVSYSDCALFHFTSERNRGITMLFDCEKFGRNLNVTILTLFTPENGMGADMVKYARSVSSNHYADSFRESILQALDSSLKEKADVYGTPSEATNNSMFE